MLIREQRFAVLDPVLKATAQWALDICSFTRVQAKRQRPCESGSNLLSHLQGHFRDATAKVPYGREAELIAADIVGAVVV